MDNYAFLGRAPQKEIIVDEAPQTEWERDLAVDEVDISTDLLGWWESHESEFPTISRMARKNEHEMGNKITVIIIILTSAAHYS